MAKKEVECKTRDTETAPLVNNNSFTQDELNIIYKLGITNTLYKSNMLNKINQLRNVLKLDPRTEPVPDNCYDYQSYTKLSEIYSSNPLVLGVLILAGCCLKPDYDDQQDEEINISGNTDNSI